MRPVLFVHKACRTTHRANSQQSADVLAICEEFQAFSAARLYDAAPYTSPFAREATHMQRWPASVGWLPAPGAWVHPARPTPRL